MEQRGNRLKGLMQAKDPVDPWQSRIKKKLGRPRSQQTPKVFLGCHVDPQAPIVLDALNQRTGKLKGDLVLEALLDLEKKYPHRP